MNKLFTVISLLLFALIANAQTARLQLVHNAAAPILNEIDIWVNDTLWLDNFSYKAATPFVDIPANTQVAVTARPKTNFNIILASQYINATEGERFILLLQGITGSGFANNPDVDAADKTIDFYVFTGAKEQSASPNTAELLIAHGSTDAQKVDFNLPGLATICDNISYGSFNTGYTSLPPTNYTIDITPAVTINPLAIYTANLSGWAGKAALVYTGGFYKPENNNFGPEFSLCYALPDGTTGCFSFISALNENTAQSSFSLYPNPTDGRVTLDLNLYGNLPLQLIDSSGKIVYQKNVVGQGLTTLQIDCSNLANGLYTIVYNGNKQSLLIVH